ncbi:MAG: hypothetical protein HFJ46_00925 [Clostridia bacterium]|nr:hypothetical protein [Clostridia bacterium]
MKLGTVVYKNKIYNLDYMTTEDMEKLLNTIEENKEKEIKQAKEMVKNK